MGPYSGGNWFGWALESICSTDKSSHILYICHQFGCVGDKISLYVSSAEKMVWIGKGCGESFHEGLLLICGEDIWKALVVGREYSKKRFNGLIVVFFVFLREEAEC